MKCDEFCYIASGVVSLKDQATKAKVMKRKINRLLLQWERHRPMSKKMVEEGTMAYCTCGSFFVIKGRKAKA